MATEEKSFSAAEMKAIIAEISRQNAESIKEIVQELKKPTVLEQKELDKQAREELQKQEERKRNGAEAIQKMEEKKLMQKICSHKHSDGHSHCVYIYDKFGGYILCQLNQCKVRPFVPEDKRIDPNAIYDNGLYNRLYQELPSNAIFG